MTLRVAEQWRGGSHRPKLKFPTGVPPEAQSLRGTRILVQCSVFAACGTPSHEGVLRTKPPTFLYGDEDKFRSERPAHQLSPP